MFRKIDNITRFVGLLFIAVIAITSCDMVMIDKPDLDFKSPAPTEEVNPEISTKIVELSKEQRDELEKTGHFLKIINMPPITQSTNIKSTFIYDSVSSIAKIDTETPIYIYKENSIGTVYIPLIYNNGTEFIEYGNFIVGLNIRVDALTYYSITDEDKIIVYFEAGRGTLDILSLAKKVITNPNPDNDNKNTTNLSAEQRNELEKTGHFLKLINMPITTQSKNIQSVNIYNSVSVIAYNNSSDVVKIFKESNNTSSVYVPLISEDGSVFDEDGKLIVSLVIHVDAITSYILTKNEAVLVNFESGRGTLDILSLSKSTANDRTVELTPVQREEYEKNGHYLKIINMPAITQAANVQLANIYNSVSLLGIINYGDTIKIFKETNTNTVYIPLVYTTDNTEFLEDGNFITAITIHVDALNSYVLTKSDNILVYFTSGRGTLDILSLPKSAAGEQSVELTAGQREEYEKNGHFLKIINMPPITQSTNVQLTNIYNSVSLIATVNQVETIKLFKESNNTNTVYIPLVYTIDNTEFLEDGNFITAITIHVDALNSYVLTRTDNILVLFTSGRGTLDILTLPQTIRDNRYLNITKLPSIVQSSNITGVAVYTQAGRLAICDDYSLVTTTTTGGLTTLSIPLVYQSTGLTFTDSGGYYVVFDLNIDAITRYNVTIDDHVIVNFTNGSGTLDITTLALGVKPYLTVKGLPLHTVQSAFSNIAIYDLSGKVAQLTDVYEIIITKDSDSATAKIPLYFVAQPDETFRGSGIFIVTLTVRIDATIQIIKAFSDSFGLNFVDGSALYDLADEKGYFSGGLVSYTDTVLPVIKSGTRWEMNGSFYQLSSDTNIPIHSEPYSALLYIYASPKLGGFDLEYSSAAPTYSPSKRGYYRDLKRALFKVIYLKDSTGDKYVLKRLISEPYNHFETYLLGDTQNGTITAQEVTSIVTGSSNLSPPPQTLTLQPGIYAFYLMGGGGGGGGGGQSAQGTYIQGGAGGNGAYISELLIINTATEFIIFTGSCGNGGLTNYGVSVNTFDTNVSYYENAAGRSGAGGGGGGSGSFIYSASGYLLCAAGGGGGGGAAGGIVHNSSGGGGGSGGVLSAGAGGGGGGGNYYAYILSVPIKYYQGGTGGDAIGYGRGVGGWFNLGFDLNGGHGSSATPILSIATSANSNGYPGNLYYYDPTFNQQGRFGGATHYSSQSNFTNTAGFAGIGGDGGPVWSDNTASNGLNGTHGGNNRTTTRGSGAAGGTTGVPYGTEGKFGYLKLFKVSSF